MKNAKHIPYGGRDGEGCLFARWPQVARRIRSARHLVLFLDFDGTLTPIRRRPEDVPPLDHSIQRLLRRLANAPRLDVYVISGRRFADLRSRVRVPGVRLLGLYGWEGRGVPPACKERELVLRAKRLLAARLDAMPRIWLEDKNLGIALHHRGALPAEVRAARLIVGGVVERFNFALSKRGRPGNCSTTLLAARVRQYAGCWGRAVGLCSRSLWATMPPTSPPSSPRLAVLRCRLGTLAGPKPAFTCAIPARSSHFCKDWRPRSLEKG